MLIINKLKRLIIPSVLFSAIYFALFYTYESPWQCLYSIFNGAGHMWFLPMLFWCFVASWIIHNIKIKEGYKAIIILGASLISFIPLPLRLNSAMYYMLFFYGGYWIYRNRMEIAGKLTREKIVTLWCVFAILFVGLTCLTEDINEILPEQPLYYKALLITGKKLCNILYAASGTMALYVTALKYTWRKELKSWIIKLGPYCMGVYIIQQFILQLLYYRTNLSIMVGPIWLPWVGFIITLAISLLLTILAHKTALGRKLL